MNETIEGGNYICKIRLVLAGTDRPEFMAEWLKQWTVKPAARHSSPVHDRRKDGFSALHSQHLHRLVSACL